MDPSHIQSGTLVGSAAVTMPRIVAVCDARSVENSVTPRMNADPPHPNATMKSLHVLSAR